MIDFIELESELEGDEGLRLFVYDDATGLLIKPGTLVKGHPSIGTGRCLDTHGISKTEAVYLNNNDIQAVAGQLDSALPWFKTLDSVRQTALANMSFNLGMYGLLGFHDTLSFIAAGAWDRAADSMLASKWATQIGARAKRLAEMIRTGIKPVR